MPPTSQCLRHMISIVVITSCNVIAHINYAIIITVSRYTLAVAVNPRWHHRINLVLKHMQSWNLNILTVNNVIINIAIDI